MISIPQILFGTMLGSLISGLGAYVMIIFYIDKKIKEHVLDERERITSEFDNKINRIHDSINSLASNMELKFVALSEKQVSASERLEVKLEYILEEQRSLKIVMSERNKNV